MFTVDQVTGLIRTKTVLDHEERAIYRLAVAATDGGYPPKETVRVLRVEVLDLNDNRPTFTSSSLVFNVSQYYLTSFQYYQTFFEQHEDQIKCAEYYPVRGLFLAHLLTMPTQDLFQDCR